MMELPAPPGPPPTEHSRGALSEVGWLFLKLGVTGFGGPAAHIAMMEDEVVRRRQWISRAEFLDLLGATNLIPGPNSTELAIHLGHRRAGWPGLLLAGVAFILPAFFIVLGVAAAYLRYGKLPLVAGVLHGIQPVIIAIMLQALWGLARTAVKTRTLAGIGLGVMAANFLGVNELLLLLIAALLAAGSGRALHQSGLVAALAFPASTATAAPLLAASAAASGAASGFGLGPLFWFFLKVGSVLFGSGYVLLAFLRADLVEHWHWLSEAQLLDAVAVGQITPGPVFTTATFIGFQLGGCAGAVVATVAIFLPAFFFVAITAPWIARLRASALAGAFLDGLNVASCALLAVVTGTLAHHALRDGVSILLLAGAALALLRFRVNSAWLVLAGAAIGWLTER